MEATSPAPSSPVVGAAERAEDDSPGSPGGVHEDVHEHVRFQEDLPDDQSDSGLLPGSVDEPQAEPIVGPETNAFVPRSSVPPMDSPVSQITGLGERTENVIEKLAAKMRGSSWQTGRESSSEQVGREARAASRFSEAQSEMWTNSSTIGSFYSHDEPRKSNEPAVLNAAFVLEQAQAEMRELQATSASLRASVASSKTQQAFSATAPGAESASAPPSCESEGGMLEVPRPSCGVMEAARRSAAWSGWNLSNVSVDRLSPPVAVKQRPSAGAVETETDEAMGISISYGTLAVPVSAPAVAKPRARPSNSAIPMQPLDDVPDPQQPVVDFADSAPGVQAFAERMQRLQAGTETQAKAAATRHRKSEPAAGEHLAEAFVQRARSATMAAAYLTEHTPPPVLAVTLPEPTSGNGSTRNSQSTQDDEAALAEVTLDLTTPRHVPQKTNENAAQLQELLNDVYEKICVCSDRLKEDRGSPEADLGEEKPRLDTAEEAEWLRRALTGMHQHLLSTQERSRSLELRCQEYEEDMQVMAFRTESVVTAPPAPMMVQPPAQLTAWPMGQCAVDAWPVGELSPTPRLVSAPQFVTTQQEFSPTPRLVSAPHTLTPTQRMPSNYASGPLRQGPLSTQEQSGAMEFQFRCQEYEELPMQPMMAQPWELGESLSAVSSAPMMLQPSSLTTGFPTGPYRSVGATPRELSPTPRMVSAPQLVSAPRELSPTPCMPYNYASGATTNYGTASPMAGQGMPIIEGQALFQQQGASTPRMVSAPQLVSAPRELSPTPCMPYNYAGGATTNYGTASPRAGQGMPIVGGQALFQQQGASMGVLPGRWGEVSAQSFPQRLAPQPAVQVVERVVPVPMVEIQERIVEHPEIQVVERVVERIEKVIQMVDKHVSKVEIQEVTRTVPKIQVVTQERIVEVPEIRYVEKLLEVPETVVQFVDRHVPRIQYQEVVKQVPLVQIQTQERIIEVPEVQYVEKIVQVPETVVQYTDRHVPRIQIQEVVKEVPIVQIQQQERIIEVPEVQWATQDILRSQANIGFLTPGRQRAAGGPPVSAAPSFAFTGGQVLCETGGDLARQMENFGFSSPARQRGAAGLPTSAAPSFAFTGGAQLATTPSFTTMQPALAAAQELQMQLELQLAHQRKHQELQLEHQRTISAASAQLQHQELQLAAAAAVRPAADPSFVKSITAHNEQLAGFTGAQMAAARQMAAAELGPPVGANESGSKSAHRTFAVVRGRPGGACC